MVVIITMTSMILAVCTTTLVTLLRSERQLRGDTSQLETLGRLASRWRSDAHAATSAAADSGCAFALPDGRTVHYEFSPPRISREIRRGQSVEHRDAFVLSAGAKVAFSTKEEAGGRLAELSIEPGERPQKAFPAAWRCARFVAAVNLHRLPTDKEGTP